MGFLKAYAKSVSFISNMLHLTGGTNTTGENELNQECPKETPLIASRFSLNVVQIRDGSLPIKISVKKAA